MALLLASVRRRDESATAQLLKRWVHRQGLESIQVFCRTTLTAQEGAEASAWLQERIEAPRPQTITSVSLVADPLPTLEPPADRVEAPPEGIATGTSEQEVPAALSVPVPSKTEAPFAEQPAIGSEEEFSDGSDEATAPSTEPSPAPAANVSQAGASSVQLEVAAIDPWLSPAERPSVADFGLPPAESPDVSPVESLLPTTAEASPPPVMEAAADAEVMEGEDAMDDEPESAPIGGRLRTLGRLGSKMWSSLETLGRGRPRSEDDTDDTDFTHDDDAAELIVPASMEKPVEDPEAGSPGSPAPPAPRSVLPPEASLPQTPSSERPAPPPSSLQDLRAWLPDAGDSKEFPRAC